MRKLPRVWSFPNPFDSPMKMRVRVGDNVLVETVLVSGGAYVARPGNEIVLRDGQSLIIEYSAK